MEYSHNLGKGGAVRTVMHKEMNLCSSYWYGFYSEITQGMLLARGQYTLFVDADGATDIYCFDKVF